MRKLLIPAVLVTAAALVAGLYFMGDLLVIPPKEVKPEIKLMASVNGRPITADAFRRSYDRFASRFNLPREKSAGATDEVKMSFLNKLIETELLLQEAEVRGLAVTDEELNREIDHLKQDYPKETLNEALERIGMKLEEWKEDRKEKLLIDKLIDREIDSIIHVSDDEVAEYYSANKGDFKQPLMVRARQIVVATEEEAKALRSRLLRGEDFAELARLYSLSPDAEQGGDLGTFGKGQMPDEFDQVVFRYRVGTITRVVQSPYGFHVFRVDERIPPRTLALEEVREDIRKRIFQGRQESFFNEWLTSLKEQAQIVVYPENLRELS
ncbi:MAG: peptidyl-prolyl cis-trans isomerase [bacterium]|nr:MAG: peptidyl-prolyl cis-trans isomerase [bacterium]